MYRLSILFATHLKQMTDKTKLLADKPNGGPNDGLKPPRDTKETLRDLIETACCDVLKFIYGFLFGYLMWSIIVRPYVGYYDFTFGYWWPELVFSSLVALVYMLSLRARCVMVLFLPSMVGNASQNYVIILLFISLFTSPISNIGLNAVESIRVIGCSLTMTFDSLRERAKLLLNPIVEVFRDDEGNAAGLEPIKRDLVGIKSLIDEMRQGAQLGAPTTRDHNKSVEKDKRANNDNNNNKFKSDQLTPNEIVERVINKTEVSLDPGNAGVKASIDVDSELIRLIKQQQQQQQLAGGDNQFNITETLYNSCMDIFRDAKGNCQSVLEDMRQSCQRNVGPYFSALWCSPVVFTFESACPWLMDQLVDENSICRQLRDPNLLKFSWSKSATTTDEGITDINEVFRNLTCQLNDLSNDLIVQNQQQQQQLEGNNRLELSITFNEKTRDLFTKTRALVNYITDKYKMRKLFANIILFVYDLYTTYTFLLIIYQASSYRRDYLKSIRFDNCYITGEFVDLDKRQQQRQQRPLLPLTSEESKKYVTTFTCKRRTKEEKQYQRASCWMILMFLAFTLSLIYLDNIFYSLLQSIHEHSLITYKQIGHHELDIKVHGEGSLARLVKRLTSRLSSVYDLNQLVSSQPCLPRATATTGKFYLEFAGLVVLYFLIDQISIYAMRLRRLTCAFFYPSKEHNRIVYLHKFIRHQRKLSLAGYVDPEEDRQVDLRDENVYTLKDALAYLANCGRSSLAS